MNATYAQTNSQINRRGFLTFAWLASLGFLSLEIGGVAYLFARPILRQGEFGTEFAMGRLGELLPYPGGDPINVPKGKFWLSRTSDNHLVAPYKVCPHLGCLYNWDSGASRFICPCHLSMYELDGTYIRGPAPRSTDRLVIRLLDEAGVEVARTNPQGDPLLLPGEDLQVVVDTSQRIMGKPKGGRYTGSA